MGRTQIENEAHATLAVCISRSIVACCPRGCGVAVNDLSYVGLILPTLSAVHLAIVVVIGIGVE
jgi:hypothetical protein